MGCAKCVILLSDASHVQDLLIPAHHVLETNSYTKTNVLTLALKRLSQKAKFALTALKTAINVLKTRKHALLAQKDILFLTHHVSKNAPKITKISQEFALSRIKNPSWYISLILPFCFYLPS